VGDLDSQVSGLRCGLVRHESGCEARHVSALANPVHTCLSQFAMPSADVAWPTVWGFLRPQFCLFLFRSWVHTYPDLPPHPCTPVRWYSEVFGVDSTWCGAHTLHHHGE
jgi:hypothetical protein